MTMASSSRCPRTSERRAFLGEAAEILSVAALSGLGSCLLGGCTIPPRTFRAPAGAKIKIPLEKYPELGRPGGLIRVIIGRQLWIFVRRGEGEAFEGISAICTHQGCIVAPAADGFRCPCHGSTYDRDGGNIGGPARRPLARFPVSRLGDIAVLLLEEEP